MRAGAHPLRRLEWVWEVRPPAAAICAHGLVLAVPPVSQCYAAPQAPPPSLPHAAQALSQFGTDFTLISHLFPGRQRPHLKNKFKRESKVNPRRVDAALKASASATATSYQVCRGWGAVWVRGLHEEERELGGMLLHCKRTAKGLQGLGGGGPSTSPCADPFPGHDLHAEGQRDDRSEHGGGGGGGGRQAPGGPLAAAQLPGAGGAQPWGAAYEHPRTCGSPEGLTLGTIFSHRPFIWISLAPLTTSLVRLFKAHGCL